MPVGSGGHFCLVLPHSYENRLLLTIHIARVKWGNDGGFDTSSAETVHKLKHPLGPENGQDVDPRHEAKTKSLRHTSPQESEEIDPSSDQASLSSLSSSSSTAAIRTSNEKAGPAIKGSSASRKWKELSKIHDRFHTVQKCCEGLSTAEQSTIIINRSHQRSTGGCGIVAKISSRRQRRQRVVHGGWPAIVQGRPIITCRISI